MMLNLTPDPFERAFDEYMADALKVKDKKFDMSENKPRKAEAMKLLLDRGYQIGLEDLKPANE